ncbi:hypothetical protein COO09_18130 [Rhizorhabdus dicambivorans]|uniref:Uncharacterized protein n=1 Tax=Rhizorhabdus dicambivorans TaxID=1850238 RepID=A0A2A4FRZ2_9SPHN|nr:hypothetical protein CMV14_07660 [Rhizorhabdus dicambivorans]PCE40947.1 hypothetical protein COO09_18130 [Rhizorhabdus dicambivorans]
MAIDPKSLVSVVSLFGRQLDKITGYFAAYAIVRLFASGYRANLCQCPMKCGVWIIGFHARDGLKRQGSGVPFVSSGNLKIRLSRPTFDIGALQLIQNERKPMNFCQKSVHEDVAPMAFMAFEIHGEVRKMTVFCQNLRLRRRF